MVRNDGKDDVTGSYIYVRVPVIADDGEVTCVIEVGTTSEVISGKVDEMRQSVMITLVLVILIVILLFGEILSFFDLKAKYKKKEVHQKNEMPLHLLRLGIFITYMAFNVSSSFLPVYAASFVTDQLGIPKELAASLPITLNLAFIGLTSLFCAKILERLSFRTVFVGSAVICMAGDLMLFLGQGYYWIVLGLILNGMGVGFITNSAYMFLAGSSQEEVQKEGFSLFNAGSLAGINCGMMIGASLAENLGQRLVFCCSAGAWLLVAVLFFIMGKHIPRIQRERKQREKAGKFRVLKMPFMYMLLIQFPYIIINSFVFYYVPIYGDEHGFGESIVCLLLMLNSLCSVFLSVVMTNYMSRKYKENSIFISSIIAYAALLLFGWNNSVVMLVIVLIMLGIAGSFGNAVRQLYFIQLPEVKQYGEESAMGIYNFMDNIGESAGPILFGSIFSRAYAFTGLAAFVAVSGIINGIYVLFNKKHGKSR